MKLDFQAFLPRMFNDKPFGPGDLIALADEAEVDRMVVMPEVSDQPDNAGVAERISGNSRLTGCAVLNPSSGTSAVGEFKKCAKELGFKGLRLFPIAHGYEIDAPIVRPLMEVAREAGIPVTVDGFEENCSLERIARLAGWFPDISIIVDLGFRPLAFPKGFREGDDNSIDRVAERCGNLNFGITAMTAAEPHYVRSTVEAVGAERVVFGSGAPYGIPAFAVGGVELAGLGDEAKELIYGQNLVRIYGLE